MRRACSSAVPSRRSSENRSSACCASSSTISASRSGASFKGATWRRMAFFQSGIFHPGDAMDGLDERLPAFALPGQDLTALGGQTVVAAAALALFFHPASLNPAALFQAVEQGIERSGVKAEGARGALFDQLADFVAVTGAGFHQGED